MDNATWVTAVSTVILVVITGIYAWRTYVMSKATVEQAEANKRMADEMKRTTDMQTMPSIVVYFDNPLSNLIDLVVKNVGYGAAKEVRLSIEPTFLDYKDRDIAELSLFKQGIDFFPPNREFREIVGTSTTFFSGTSSRPLKYQLVVNYSNLEGREFIQRINMDMSVYRDLPIHRESDIDKLTKEVTKISEQLEEINKSLAED